MGKREPRTKGSRSILNFFEELRRRVDFQKDVAKIRSDFKIPLEGLKMPPDGIDWIFWSLPPQLESKAKLKEFNTILEGLSSKYRMGPLSNKFKILTLFVLYDVAYIPDELGTCIFEDVPASNARTRSAAGIDTKTYPVALWISPYATLRDVKDYLDSVFEKKVVPVLKKYRDEESRNGKVRTKKNQALADFVYENRKRHSLRTLHRACVERFGPDVPDYGTLGKIFSEEQKRREKK